MKDLISAKERLSTPRRKRIFDDVVWMVIGVMCILIFINCLNAEVLYVYS